MKKSIRNSAYLGALVLVLSGVISCEEDFTDIKSGVVSNTKFSTGEVVLDIEINPLNIQSITADNIGIPRLQNGGLIPVDYWLGVYKKINAKKVKASFVSQLGLPSNLVTSEIVVDGDTIYNLDKVVLKIPYTAVSLGKNTDGITTFRLDSILGNTSVTTSVDVYRNPTFLNVLNPTDPSKGNFYASNFDYQETELLSEAAGFTFKPLATDTIFTFDRIDRSKNVSSTDLVSDVLELQRADSIPTPFLAIPLDLDKMKTLFWDKFNDTEFSSSEEFQNYFRGVILKTKGDDGALVPLNLSSNANLAVDFLYSKTVINATGDNEIIKEAYSFLLGGIQNSIYEMEDIAATPANSFVVQGAAGLSTEIKVIGVNLSNLGSEDPFLTYADKDLDNNNYLDLEELATIRDIDNNEFGLLINDADLTFMVNTALSSNKDILPQQLYVYQNKDNGNGGITPTHLSDSYGEASFSGVLLLKEDKLTPESYTFKITDYISDLIDGSSSDFSPLVLKVFNPTDNAVITGSVNENVLQYNWNPRSVVLYDENGASIESNKARLKLSYTKKKN